MKALFYNNWEASYISDILKEIYLDKIYAPYFLGKKDLTILDVGANIGLATNYFAKYGKVYAVEPCQEHFDCLTKMVEFNELKNVTPIQYAISTTNGEATFYHSPNSTANSFFKMVEGADSEIVKTHTLGELFKEYKLEHVDFMKLDIEGSEYDVLGSDTFDEVADKIDAIMGETHKWANRNPGQVYQALQNRGFKVRNIPTDAAVFYAER